MGGLTVSGVHWWLETLKFILAVFWAFFIPGHLFLFSKNICSPLVCFTLSVLIGLVLWGWQEYLFGWLSLRWLSYLYLLIFLFIWILRFKDRIFPFFRSFKTKRLKIDWLVWLMIFLGVASQVFPLWQNGIFFQDKGLLFQGGNPEDNLWHASLTNQMVKNFPPFAPSLPGILMKNYHYWSNLVIGSLIRVFKLPLFPAQFHFFPILVSLLLGLAALSFGQVLNLGQKFKRFFVFFNYFGGDLIYFLLFFLRKGPNFFAMSSLEDGVKFLYNPPRAFSYVIALGGLTLLVLWQKKKKNHYGFLSMLLLASTTGFKIYTVLFFIPGVVLLALISFLRKQWLDFLVYLSFFLFGAVVYFPVNARAGGLVWTPFLIANNFIVQPNLGLVKWELARQIFLADKKYFKNFIFEIIFTLIFLTGVLGTKIFGFFQSPLFMVKKLGKSLLVILALGFLTSLIAGLFFIQTTGGGNTFNFIVSVFLFGSILISLSLVYWQKKLPKTLFFLLAFLIILLTLPRFFYETNNNLRNFLNPQGFFISQEELKLYQVVNQKTWDSTGVAIDPDHYLGRISPYVSLFIDLPLYVTGPGLLKHFHLPVQEQIETQKLIYLTSSGETLAEELFINEIGFIILNEGHHLNATESAFFTTSLVKNKRGEVLSVDQEKLLEVYPSLKKLKKSQSQGE